MSKQVYSGSVVVSQYDNGISYEVNLHVVERNGKLTLSSQSNNTWLPLNKLQDFASKVYTGTFTNNTMHVVDFEGNYSELKLGVKYQ